MTKSRKNIIIALLIGLIGSMVMLICVNMSNVKTAKAEEITVTGAFSFTYNSEKFTELTDEEKNTSWAIGSLVKTTDNIAGKYLLFYDMSELSIILSGPAIDSGNASLKMEFLCLDSTGIRFRDIETDTGFTVPAYKLRVYSNSYYLVKMPEYFSINLLSISSDMNILENPLGEYCTGTSYNISSVSGKIYFADKEVLEDGEKKVTYRITFLYNKNDFCELTDLEKNVNWELGTQVEKGDNVAGKYLLFSSLSDVLVKLIHENGVDSYPFSFRCFGGYNILCNDTNFDIGFIISGYSVIIADVEYTLVYIPETFSIKMLDMGSDEFCYDSFVPGKYTFDSECTVSSCSGSVYYPAFSGMSGFSISDVEYNETTEEELNAEWLKGREVQVGDDLAGKYLLLNDSTYFTYYLNHIKYGDSYGFEWYQMLHVGIYDFPNKFSQSGHRLYRIKESITFNGEEYVLVKFPINMKMVVYGGVPEYAGDIHLGIYELDTIASGKIENLYYANISLGLNPTPELTAIDGGVNISEVENASGYTCVVNDSAEQTLTIAGSIALNSGDTIKAKTNCSEYYSDSEYTETYTYYNVKHPTVTVDRYGVASWDSIENATSYEVYVDNELKTTTNSCTYTLTDGQTIKVCSVRTAAENELVYISDNVEEVTYTKETLATPLVSINKNGLVSWTSVPNAEKYIVKLLGVYEVETTDTSYQLYGGNIVEVKAVGNSSLYNDSEYSDRLSYSLTLPSDLREVKVGDDLSGKTLYILDFGTTYSGLINFLSTEQGYLVYCPLALTTDSSSYVFVKIDSKEFAEFFRGFDIHDKLMLPLPDGMGVVTELNYDLKVYVSASEMGDPIDSGNISDINDKENTIGKRLTTIIGLTAGMALVAVCGLVFIPKKKKHR